MLCHLPSAHLQERHSDELREFQQKLVAKSTATRHSREYYDLREMQDKLAHNKNYAAAGKIKGKADELMAFEEEKWGNERHMEMLHKENVFKSKLSLEAESLRKRVAQGRAEQNRARQVALEKMLLRYHSASLTPPPKPYSPPPFFSRGNPLTPSTLSPHATTLNFLYRLKA